MSRGKLKRFADIKLRKNVLEPGKPIYEKIKGNWHSGYFENDHPITLELACGRGEYTVGLAEKYPERNFIGVDLKGDRIWKGSGWAIERKLDNVAFLRTEILLLEKFFEPGEFHEIWLTFPDPRPKDRDEKRRITNPRFLELYRTLIAPGGTVRLKTDNTGLFNYTLETLQGLDYIENLTHTHDVYNSSLEPEVEGIDTKFERKHRELGASIKYLRFQFRNH